MRQLFEIKIRLSEEEKNNLTMQADRAGLSREEFCRRILRGAEVKEAPPADLPYFIRELRRVGSNINQILKIANSMRLLDVPKLREALEETRRIERIIVKTYAKGEN